MAVAIIGAGNVGTALGGAFRRAGETVHIGVRDPADPKHDGLRQADLSLKTPLQAAAEAGTILLAVPWVAVADAIAGMGDITGKVLIDATNPLKADFSDIDPSPDRSGGEAVARLAPGARVAKAFNTMTSSVMADPDFGPLKPALAVAADDEQARAEAGRLGRAIGLAPYNAGPLSAARDTERFAWHVINLAVLQGHGRHACFAFMNKPG